MNAVGRPAISFLDEKGSSKINIGIDEQGQPGLGFVDASGVFRAGLGVRAENGLVGSSLTFNNADGEARLVVGLNGSDLPSLLFKDSAGQTRASIQVTGDDVARLQLMSHGEKGLRGVRIEAKPGADSTIDFSNAGGQMVRLPSRP
jgi:hypothetical protein